MAPCPSNIHPLVYLSASPAINSSLHQWRRKALLLYSPGDWGPSTEVQNEQKSPVSPEVTGGRSQLILVAVGGPVLLADLLELGLDDLDDLRVVQVRLGNAYVQRSHLDELPVRSLLLDVAVKFFVERMVKGEAIVDVRCRVL
jgi:hypothetical protein